MLGTTFSYKFHPNEKVSPLHSLSKHDQHPIWLFIFSKNINLDNN
jgi:hypothetical protein